MEDEKTGCKPCKDFEKLPWPHGTPEEPKKKPPCPDDFKDACKQVNDQFKLWKKWGKNVNDTLFLYAQFIWRIEYALCCLEGHVIYGKARPKEGFICDGDGNFKPGTLHELTSPPWPISDPPDEPWAE